jgi:hypothetical protein
LEALHHPHVVCAFSIVAFPPCALGIAWSTGGEFVSIRRYTHVLGFSFSACCPIDCGNAFPSCRAARGPVLNLTPHVTHIRCARDLDGSDEEEAPAVVTDVVGTRRRTNRGGRDAMHRLGRRGRLLGEGPL